MPSSSPAQGPPGGPTEVALAVLLDGHGRVLLQRRDRAPFEGAWELPGGKVRPGEAPAAAAVRELREEVGVGGTPAGPWLTRVHAYPGGPMVRLHAVRVVPDGPVPEAAGLRWVPLAEAASMPVLEGTRPILAALATEASAPAVADPGAPGGPGAPPA